MTRLQNQWRQAYGDERTEVMFREFGSLPLDTFRRMVDRALAESSFAPLSKDFRTYLAEDREETLMACFREMAGVDDLRWKKAGKTVDQRLRRGEFDPEEVEKKRQRDEAERRARIAEHMKKLKEGA
jgi:hypothetical protein